MAIPEFKYKALADEQIDGLWERACGAEKLGDTGAVAVDATVLLALLVEVRAARAPAVVRIDFSNLPPEKQRRVDELLEQIRTAPTHAMAVREADDALESAIIGAPCVGRNWRTCPTCNPPLVPAKATAPRDDDREG